MLIKAVLGVSRVPPSVYLDGTTKNEVDGCGGLEVVTLAVTTIRLTFIFIAVSASMIFPALVAASMQEACWYLGGGGGGRGRGM